MFSRIPVYKWSSKFSLKSIMFNSKLSFFSQRSATKSVRKSKKELRRSSGLRGAGKSTPRDPGGRKRWPGSANPCNPYDEIFEAFLQPIYIPTTCFFYLCFSRFFFDQKIARDDSALLHMDGDFGTDLFVKKRIFFLFMKNVVNVKIQKSACIFREFM